VIATREIAEEKIFVLFCLSIYLPR